MKIFSCKHVPHPALIGDKRIIVEERLGRWFVEKHRVLVTDNVCRRCNVHFVTRHDIDEVSAAVGPRAQEKIGES